MSTSVCGSTKSTASLDTVALSCPLLLLPHLLWPMRVSHVLLPCISLLGPHFQPQHSQLPRTTTILMAMKVTAIMTCLMMRRKMKCYGCQMHSQNLLHKQYWGPYFHIHCYFTHFLCSWSLFCS